MRRLHEPATPPSSTLNTGCFECLGVEDAAVGEQFEARWAYASSGAAKHSHNLLRNRHTSRWGVAGAAQRQPDLSPRVSYELNLGPT
jgi:hypothetical protein